MRFQIARCAHHNIAPRNPQRECDHVDRHEVGATDAEVEAARDDVHQAALCDDVDVDLRVRAQERQDEPREDLPRRCREGVDAQCARRRGLLRARNVHRLMNVPHGGRDLRDELLACLRQGDASRRPVEKPYAERALQLSDRIAERGGGNPEFKRSRAELAPAGDHENGVQFDQAALHHCPDFRDEASRIVLIIARPVHRYLGWQAHLQPLPAATAASRTKTMSLELPSPIAAYVAANARLDVDGMLNPSQPTPSFATTAPFIRVTPKSGACSKRR